MVKTGATTLSLNKFNVLCWYFCVLKTTIRYVIVLNINLSSKRINKILYFSTGVKNMQLQDYKINTIKLKSFNPNFLRLYLNYLVFSIYLKKTKKIVKFYEI